MGDPFSEVKRPQTYLLMSFNKIRIMVGYILEFLKNQYVESLVMVAWCLQQNIVIFMFNMLLLTGKSFLRSQKGCKLIYL